MKIKSILIADDHELIMVGINSILKEHFTIDEIVMLTNPQDVIDQVDKRLFDLYILDLEFKDITGFSLIKHIRKKDPNAKIIVNTMHEEIWNVNQLLELGTNAIILKRSSGEYLKHAVTAVMKNKQFLCPKFEKLKEKYAIYRKRVKSKNSQLTQTEQIVLKYIVEGYTSKAIAEALSVSEDAIEAHRKNLFIKLEARNVAHLVSIAIRQQLVE